MGSRPRITWYYDFISPFAYLQSARLGRLAEIAEIDCVPLLFAGLLDHWGQKGPAEVAPKKVFAFRQCVWRARRDGIAFRLPPMHPFNPLRALRLAISLNNELEAVQAIFRAIWVDGHLPDDDAGWAALQAAVGIDDGDARVADPAVKARLAENGAAATKAGVFGVPTIAIAGELFWGDDALEMAQAFLADPTIFDDEDMKRIETLAPSAERRQKK